MGFFFLDKENRKGQCVIRIKKKGLRRKKGKKKERRDKSKARYQIMKKMS